MKFAKLMVLSILAYFSAAIGSADTLNLRTLVVFVSNDPDSVSVKNHYVAQRAIPPGNICALALPNIAASLLSLQDYQTYVANPIKTCLSGSQQTNILYIVLAYVRPFTVYSPSLPTYSMDSYLSDLWNKYTTQNFSLVPTSPHRYFADNQNQGYAYVPFVDFAAYRSQPRSTLLYSVWRLDGATPAIANNLVDNALQVELSGPPPSSQACLDLWIADPLVNPLPDAGYYAGDWDLKRASMFAGQAGLPVTLDANVQEFGTLPAGRCDNAFLYSGWYALGHYNDAFTWLTGAIGFHLDSESAYDPRGGGNWSANALIKGITVTSGAVNEPYLEGLPRPAGVFRDLLTGANVGDAFLRNTRWLKWMIVNIGDPLYRPFAGGLPLSAAPSFALTTRELLGGTSTSGRITLTAPAPQGGTTFNLSSSDASVTLPASVTIPEGQATLLFSITTSSVSNSKTAVLHATGPFNLDNTLTVDPLLSFLDLSPNVVVGGQTTTGTVYLNGSAPFGGLTVTLSSSNQSVASAPASVVVPAGTTKVSFPVTTSPVSQNTTVSLQAIYGATNVSAGLVVTAP